MIKLSEMSFERITTSIGAPLYVFPMEHAHTVAMGAFVSVGSRDEQMPGEAGLAHITEHALLQGTKEFPSKQLLFAYLEEVGGYQNALTLKETTLFYNQVPFREVDRSVHVLSEQLQNSLLSEGALETEKKIVIEEINRALDNPARMVQEFAWEHVFSNGPLAHAVLGTKESVSGFRQGALLDFVKQHYHPVNLTFLAAGNVKPKAAEDLLNAYFRGMPPSVSGEKRAAQGVHAYANLHTVPWRTRQLHMQIAVPVFGADEKTKRCLQLFAVMLGTGTSSPLYEEMRNRRGLAYTVYASYYPGTDTGLFSIYLATSKKDYQQFAEVCLSVLKEHEADEELFEKAKAMMLGGRSRASENPLDVVDQAARDNLFFGRPLSFDETENLIGGTTLRDLVEAVDTYLIPEHFARVVLLPE